MPETPRQLPLILPHEQALGRDDYLVGQANRAALEMIESWPSWPAPVTILAGPVGSGKTHLVEIWRRLSGATVLEARALTEAAVADLVAAGPVALENAHRGVDETALFHLINAARQAGVSLLVTSRTWPAAWNLTLPDLVSRLRAATPVEIAEPDDDLLRRVLVKLFADRQVMIDPSVVDYLVVRMERSLGVAGRVVEALDAEALAGGCRITRSLAGRVLERLESGTD
ncbi:hypothetical protein GWI72_06580 [Microvirga tunisiensis]|uniref:Uncharacterized protein n=2 Tax=Pannonibacter tanglangensis TaxID=2750084 RepID=A0A7X5F1A9_9HYPH|nr:MULTISPECIES: hypothetical protein [unclassified Pannonibacter]NBN62265.1 hypothetical protein [Pannonibacter sp. XCT-34]NBN77933.1 hypothetical protein [Pannonibacter sp. XCT-53]